MGVLGGVVFLSLLMVDGWERQIPVFDLCAAATVPMGYAVTNTIIRRSLRHVPALELTLSSLLIAGSLLCPLALVGDGPRNVLSARRM